MHAITATDHAKWEALHNRIGLLMELEAVTVSDAYRQKHTDEIDALWPEYVRLCELVNPR